MCEPKVLKTDADRARQGTRLGAASLGLLFLANSLTMAHQQALRDRLGCQSACQGSLTSTRSTLNLIGAAVMGRVSDMEVLEHLGGGRRLCLWSGLLAAGVSLTMAQQAHSVEQLYWSVLPLAAEQNLPILKALFSDYHTSATASERAASSGSLGMSVGLAMMIGPAAGSMLISDYALALNVAFLFLSLAALLVAYLPDARLERRKLGRASSRFWSALDVPSARSPPALFLLSCRLLAALSYHIYNTIFTPSLKERFDFGPRDYGRFFSVVGLFFALSQGFVAKWLLERWGAGQNARTRLLAVCCGLMAVLRYAAFVSSNLTAVYVMFAIMVTSYGVTSTIFSADTSQIPAPEETGAFFGLLAAVESGAGMLGPLLGSALTYWHPTLAPLLAVVALNVVATALVGAAYERVVLRSLEDKVAKTE